MEGLDMTNKRDIEAIREVLEKFSLAAKDLLNPDIPCVETIKRALEVDNADVDRHLRSAFHSIFLMVIQAGEQAIHELEKSPSDTDTNE